MRVLVTDGANRAALAITRSLGRRGHDVLVGEKRAPSLAQTSRYCAERIVYPDPVTEPAAFVEALAAIVRDRRVDVLLPVAESQIISRSRLASNDVRPVRGAAVVGGSRKSTCADGMRLGSRAAT